MHAVMTVLGLGEPEITNRLKFIPVLLTKRSSVKTGALYSKTVSDK